MSIQYVNVADVKQAFAQHLMKYRHYSKQEAELAVSDFPDPYENCYLCEEYLDNCEIDGEEYEMHAGYTELYRIGIDIPMFCYYVYYRCSDVPNNKVGEYQEAHKLYQLTDLDEDDFPEGALEEHELPCEEEENDEIPCCTDCGEPSKELTCVDECTFVCPKCLDSGYVYCDGCNQYWVDTAIDVYHLDDGRTLCEYCAEDEGIIEEEEEDFEPSDDPVPLTMASVGNYIKFGTYEQDCASPNGKEDIEWLVLAKKNKRLLVISRYALDCKPYNTKRQDVTWETCTLREWLNNDFFHSAFSSTEQAQIPTVIVPADENSLYNTNPGNATQDKVFLLSIEEADNCISEVRCNPTAYAKHQGVSFNKDGYCYWWLRSPGSDQSHASCGNADGNLTCTGGYVDIDFVSVRPAMWIALNP